MQKKHTKKKKKTDKKTKQHPEQEKSPTFLASVQYQDSVLGNKGRDSDYISDLFRN